MGKLDRTDEFLLLTPTGAMKARCARRLEGVNALGFATPESVCWQSVEYNSKEHGAGTNDTTKRMSWQVVDVRKGCTYDNILD